MKKAEIRKIGLAQRTQLAEKEFLERSQRVIETLAPLLTPGKTIASFKAIPHRNEISLDSLEGTFAFPRVISAAEGSMEMAFSKTFTNSAWGIPEPVGGTVVQPTDFDIVLIPLLAFDKYGHRVGYGKGFYDRTLAGFASLKHHAVTIGVAWDKANLKDLDPDYQPAPHDHRLDAIITPTQWYPESPAWQGSSPA